MGTSVRAQSFSVSATPQAVTIHPGDQNVAVSVNVSGGTYTGPISVTLTGLPSGISVSPLTIASGGSGTLTLNASVNADQEAFPPTDPANANSYTNTVTVVAAAGSIEATSTLMLTVSLTNPSFAPNASQINLPIVTINTSGTPIVDKTTDVPGTITITSADGQTSYLPNSSDSDNTATFHVHGDSTALMPKLPYEMNLTTSVDLLSAMGLTCPYVTSSGKATCDKSKDYVLLANYDDKTFLRDWAASALANAIPIGGAYLSSPAGSPSPSGTSTLMPWAPHSLFVELYLNGLYEGNYQLIEKVNVDSHRINITELSDTDTTDVSGGYLLEIDQEGGEDYIFFTPEGVQIGLIDPDFTPEVPQQTSYITNDVDNAEDALFSGHFTDPIAGWRVYFDEASAVNFYIVNDVMGNVDGGSFYSSDYLYKNLDDALLYMGPIWDFDISSGNVNYEPIVSPAVSWMQTQAIWYVQWFKDPGFKADVVTQWNTLKANGVFTAWLASITQEATGLEQSQANNFGRWPMQGIEVWPDPQAVGTYDGEVSYLTNWINLRIGYLDSLFNGKAQTSTALGIPSGTLRAGSPVALTAQVTGGSTPTGKVSFLSNGVVIGTGTLDGSGNSSLTTTALPAGTENLQAFYNGDNTNGLSVSPTQTVTVLGPLVATVTSLASSTSIDTGGSVSFSASVIGNSGTAIPTGTLTFSANGNAFGTANLTSSGTATFATNNLPAGSDSVQAVYGGDNTYQGSSSNAVPIDVQALATPVFNPGAGTYTSAQTVTITDATPSTAIYFTTNGSTPTTASTLYAGPIAVSSSETIEAFAAAPGYASAVASASFTINLPPASFTLSVSPSSVSVRAGQAANVALTITPQNDFTEAVNFTCSGLPGGGTCSFSPSSVTPGNAPATITCTISTSANTASIVSPSWVKLGGGIVMALIFWPVRRRRACLALALFGLIVGGFVVSGCGGSPQMQSYSVTITAAGGNVSQVATVGLVVNN
jgi:hypothetical protein